MFLGEYSIGEVVHWSASFRDEWGNACDPATPTATLVDPSGDEVALPTPVKQNNVTGEFGGTIDTTAMTELGQYSVRITGVVPNLHPVSTSRSFMLRLAPGAAGGLAIVGSEMTCADATAAKNDLANATDGLGALKDILTSTLEGLGLLAQDTTELLTRTPDAAPGAAGGLAIVGSKMDLADALNELATDALTTGILQAIEQVNTKLDAPISVMSLVRKLLTNKQVEATDGETITVLDDDDQTILGTWNWDEAARTRSKLVES
jgi:hypothetical protein